MISFINISKEATSLLLEILEHEKDSNYWQQRFEGLDYREDTILRGCFGELKDNNLVNVLWADNIPYQIAVLKDGYILGEEIQKSILDALTPFEKALKSLLERSKTIKSPINAAPISVSISEYNKPSNIWINDFEIFYNKYLKDHSLAKRIETILFHRALSAYEDLVAILKSISTDTDYINGKKLGTHTQESDMKDYEVLLKKLIEKADKDTYYVTFYRYDKGERPLIEKLKNEKLIKNVSFHGRDAVSVDLTYEGYHYFEEQDDALAIKEEKTQKFRKMYDVFLSHASKDKLTYVEELKQTLDILGVQVFYDKDTIEWGDAWKNKIYEGLEKSEFAIMVISENFFDREWTELELKELLERQNEEGQKLILPILHHITPEQLKAKYPIVADIQAIESKDNSYEKIALLFARQLIKRYK